MAEKVEEIKKIPLQELINVANKYISGEWTIEQMNEYGNTLVIRGYLPLMEKVGAVMELVTLHNYGGEHTQELKVAQLYKNIFFKIILEKYAYVDCAEEELCSYDNYDLLYPIFGEFILSYCKSDYEVLKGFITDTLNLYNVRDFMETLDSIDVQALEEANKDSQKMLKDLEANKDLIQELNRVAAMNDPITTSVINQIKEIAVKESLKKDQEK